MSEYIGDHRILWACPSCEEGMLEPVRPDYETEWDEEVFGDAIDYEASLKQGVPVKCLNCEADFDLNLYPRDGAIDNRCPECKTKMEWTDDHRSRCPDCELTYEIREQSWYQPVDDD